MHAINKWSWVIGISFLISGCAFAPVERANADKYRSSIITSETFKISEDAAKNAVRISLRALGYEIESEIPELGLLRTKPEGVIVPDICDCGKWNGREISETASSAPQIRIDPVGPDTVTVTIIHYCSMNFTGRNLFYIPTHRESYICPSRGVIESQFWDYLHRALHVPPEPHSL
jgi:hypothetical protein